jgi:hypothetical protein
MSDKRRNVLDRIADAITGAGADSAPPPAPGMYHPWRHRDPRLAATARALSAIPDPGEAVARFDAVLSECNGSNERRELLASLFLAERVTGRDYPAIKRRYQLDREHLALDCLHGESIDRLRQETARDEEAAERREQERHHRIAKLDNLASKVDLLAKADQALADLVGYERDLQNRLAELEAGIPETFYGTRCDVSGNNWATLLADNEARLSGLKSALAKHPARVQALQAKRDALAAEIDTIRQELAKLA